MSERSDSDESTSAEERAPRKKKRRRRSRDSSDAERASSGSGVNRRDRDRRSNPDKPAQVSDNRDGPSTDLKGRAEDNEESPARRKRKKRRPRDPDTTDSDSTDAPTRPELDSEGRERPVFLLNFPRDKSLDLLVAAFEAGNYRAVREGAPALAEQTESDEVRRAALELRRRIDPDPLMKYLLLISVLLLVALTVYAYTHHGAHAH